MLTFTGKTVRPPESKLRERARAGSSLQSRETRRAKTQTPGLASDTLRSRGERARVCLWAVTEVLGPRPTLWEWPWRWPGSWLLGL